MIGLLKYELTSTLRRKSLLLLLFFVYMLFFYFWNGLHIFPLSTLEINLNQMGLENVSLGYAWEPTEADKELPEEEQREVFFSYYMELQTARMFREINPLFFLTVFMSAYLVSTSFFRRTFNTALYQGHPRWKIVLVKLLVFQLVILVTVLISLFVFLCVVFGFQWMHVLSQYLLRRILIWLYLCVTATSLSFLVAFICKGVLKTALVNLALLFIIGFTPTGSSDGALLGGGVFDFYPGVMMVKKMLWERSTTMLPSDWAILICMPLLFTLLCGFGAYLVFRHAELR